MAKTFKKWTKEETQLLLENITFDERGYMNNGKELQKLLSMNRTRVNARIRYLRRSGVLPSIYFDDPINPVVETFTPGEDRIIVNMIQNDQRIKEIAAALGKSCDSVSNRMRKLRKAGRLKHSRVHLYSNKEIQFVLSEVEFDRYGYVSNTRDMAKKLNLLDRQVRYLIYRLRKQGLISVLPDKTKVSVNSSEGLKAVTEVWFQIDSSRRNYYERKKKLTPVAAEVSK